MIAFNKPVVTGKEKFFFEQLLVDNKYSGDGEFTKKCTEWFAKKLKRNVLLTTSCTHALEMIALLLDIKEGDEIIMPSYTFVSTANAFVLRGARIVFVDINSNTMNIDETKIEEAITEKTKVIVPVHYAGVSCEMDTIMDLARKYNLYVVEDAAQGMMSDYKGKPLGTIGDFGTFSFHETKNYHCGEGGLLIINNEEFSEEAEIIREKGTNRSKFIRGQVDKYTWVNKGSSYLPSELNAMFLYAQLEIVNEINSKRLSLWNRYYEKLKQLESKGKLNLPYIPMDCNHNAHMFYIKLKNIEQRDLMISYLKTKEISSVFHYIPLHSSPYGKNISSFSKKDLFTTTESEKLLRLPMFFDLSIEEVSYITECIGNFFNEV